MCDLMKSASREELLRAAINAVAALAGGCEVTRTKCHHCGLRHQDDPTEFRAAKTLTGVLGKLRMLKEDSEFVEGTPVYQREEK